MNSRIGGFLYCLPGTLDIFATTACQSGDTGPPNRGCYGLHGLKIAARPNAPADKPEIPVAGEEAAPGGVPVPGFASIENVADMPDRWLGYDAVDVLVLTTSSDKFVDQLLGMSQERSAQASPLKNWRHGDVLDQKMVGLRKHLDEGHEPMIAGVTDGDPMAASRGQVDFRGSGEADLWRGRCEGHRGGGGRGPRRRAVS